jgi:predicted transcriptional regulator
MTDKELERIIDMTVDRTVKRLIESNKIKYQKTTPFKKTEEMLYLYPCLAPTNESRLKVDKALKNIEHMKYFDVIKMKYWDKISHEKLAEIYDVEVSTIYNQKKNLVRILSMYLFPEESAERILNN